MAANQKIEFEDEPTIVLAPYRTVFMGCQTDGILIHVTPTGHHTVEMDCDNVCLTCGKPLEGNDDVPAN